MTILLWYTFSVKRHYTKLQSKRQHKQGSSKQCMCRFRSSQPATVENESQWMFRQYHFSNK